MIGHWPITRSMCRGSTVAMLSAAIIESVRSPIVRPAGASFRTKTRVTPHRVKLEVSGTRAAGSSPSRPARPARPKRAASGISTGRNTESERGRRLPTYRSSYASMPGAFQSSSNAASRPLASAASRRVQPSSETRRGRFSRSAARRSLPAPRRRGTRRTRRFDMWTRIPSRSSRPQVEGDSIVAGVWSSTMLARSLDSPSRPLR